MYILYFQADVAPTTKTGPVAIPSADPLESAVPEEMRRPGRGPGGRRPSRPEPDRDRDLRLLPAINHRGATAAADTVNQGEQVGRGPQGPSGGLAPEVVAACTRAHLVNLGVAPSISGHPPVTDPSPYSFAAIRPPAAGGPQACPWSSGSHFCPFWRGPGQAF